MDFEDTPEEARFRTEVRAWFDANATQRTKPDQEFGEGLDAKQYLAAAKAWQAKKASAGYAAITYPKEMGGLGGTPAQQVVFQQEQEDYLAPSGIFEVSLGMAIPTVARWGSPEQKQRYVAAGLSGKDIWCQLFSEPAAGSDTGNIRTRAMRDGSDWIINGQKVWTSGAHFSDFGILLARTNWDVPKTKGLTMFVLDMRALGVEVRPIHQATGQYHFNEVFLTDVRIPAAEQLGAEGEGWSVMISTLMQERLSVGGAYAHNYWNPLIELAREAEWDGRPAIEDERVRAAIADCYIRHFGVELTIRRALSVISRGGTPGPEMAMVKLVGAAGMQAVGGLALELGGADALVADALGPRWHQHYLQWIGSPGGRIAGGTDEILRNTIAERVLGLPGEIRTDKDIPFRSLER